MNTLELTQRQRELLGNIVKAANQHRQAVADASARLEHENERIEQSRRQERQRIEEEREQKTEITFKKPAKDEQEQKKREEYIQRLQREIAAKRSTTTPPRSITTIEAVKGAINGLLSTKIRVDSPIDWIITIFMLFVGFISFLCCVGSAVGEGGIGVGLVGLIVSVTSVTILIALARRSNKKARIALVNRIVLFHNLCDRWLELVDEQADAQRAEAQRRYDQALAQAKGQMLAAAEQLRPVIAEFGALTERVSPSWESEAWRQWEPGRVGSGAVRLGTFKKVEV